MKQNNERINKRILSTYILLIVFHFLHFIEELVGGAYFIETMYGGAINFLIISLILFMIPIFLLYFVIKGKKIAYIISYGYALFMIVDGIYHIINKVEGVYTSVVLVIAGVFLVYSLGINKNDDTK